MAAVRRGAWTGLRYVTTLYFLGVIVQFFLVGVGLFGMKHGATIDDAHSLDAHRTFGFVLTDFGGGLMLILALLAWPRPRRLLGLWILLVLLGEPVQGVLASSGYHHKYLGMLHPVNALLLLGLSGHLARHAWTSRGREVAESSLGSEATEAPAAARGPAAAGTPST
jgi:hypothetical protein